MKTVLVTGGSKGIGLATVKRFVDLGFQVITCSRNPSVWEECLKTSPELKGVDYICCDLSENHQVEELFTYIKAKYSNLVVAINNASPTLQSTGCFSEVKLEDLQHTIMTDFWLHAICLQHELQLMGTGGNIVNISSINGLRPTPNAAMYSAAKHGLEGLTRSVAVEAIAKGIRVNSVAPGVTWTPRWDERRANNNPNIKREVEQVVPIKRFADTSEIVDAIEWVSSEKASYVVGHTLVVDGGLTLS